MSDKEKQELRIFQLCKELAKRLGEEEAIADLALRNLQNPEMFKVMQEVANLIQEVVTESKIIIVKNLHPMSEKDYIAGKELNNKKMGEVGVRRDDNIKIFHANKKKISELNRFKKRLDKKNNLVNFVGGGDAHSPHPTDKEQVWATDTKVCSPTNNIIPQTQENKSVAEQIKAESKDFNILSIDQRLALLEKNQQAIANTQSTKDLQQQRNDSMDIKQEKELKDSNNQESQTHKLKKHK